MGTWIDRASQQVKVFNITYLYCEIAHLPSFKTLCWVDISVKFFVVKDWKKRDTFRLSKAVFLNDILQRNTISIIDTESIFVDYTDLLSLYGISKLFFNVFHTAALCECPK